MKRLVFFLCAATLLAAQAPPEVEITAEPHHHFTFENQFVRVFNVEAAPHTDTLMHWHRHDYIYVTLGAAHVSNEVKGKDPVDLKLADGETHFAAATFAHIARNLSDDTFRNVTIELLQDDKLRAREAAVHWDEDRGLQILKGGTKEILFVKDGVRVSEFELQPGGVVPPHNHTGPHLVVALNNYEMRSDVQGGGPTTTQMHTGQSRWVAAGLAHTLTNVGTQTARFITIEFPERAAEKPPAQKP